MCLVIDTCCLAMVFDGNNINHRRFSPILDWINGKGCMIYGGTKYNSELKKAPKYLALVAELSKSRRAVGMDTPKVDKIALELKRSYPEPAFNDEHIIALVIASRCGVVCTVDTAAILYLKLAALFRQQGVRRPRIYRGRPEHKKLCCDQNVVGACG